jgi:uncharacterized protein YcbK (DUF882 family)
MPSDFIDKQLTKNFTLREFLFGVAMPVASHQMIWDAYKANANGEQAGIQKIADWLQVNIRDKYGPVQINCGLRCLAWEKHQGRTGKSQHVKGNAVDFIILKFSNQQHLDLFEKLKKEHKGGIAIYRRGGHVGFIHVDLYETKPPRRWEY